MNKKRLKMME